MACSNCEALKKQLATLLTAEASSSSVSEDTMDEVDELNAAVKQAKKEKATAVKNATLAVRSSQDFKAELFYWRGKLGELSEHADEQGKAILDDLFNRYAAFLLPLPDEEGKCVCPCHSS